MMRRLLLFTYHPFGSALLRSGQALSFIAIVVLATSCASTSSWWNSSGKTNAQATLSLIAQQAAAIAQATVYAKGLDAGDTLLKNFNVQGFGDGLRQLESGLPTAAIGQIPDFVMKLRSIWLPAQSHYTDLAVNLGTLIQQRVSQLEAQSGHKITSDEMKAVVEAVIKGLQTPPPALVAP